MVREILVELDERRRASLARLDPQHRRYLASTATDGTITLRPVDVVPAVVGAKPATLEPAGTAEVDQAFAEVRRTEDALNRLRQFLQSPQAHKGGDSIAPEPPRIECGAVFTGKPGQDPCRKPPGHENGPETDWKRDYHSNGLLKWPVREPAAEERQPRQPPQAHEGGDW